MEAIAGSREGTGRGLVIVTGGSKGLGAALCEEYQQRGWSVVEFSRSAPHGFSVPLDLSDTVTAERSFVQTFETLGSAESMEVVAFNNAAVLGPVGPVDGLAPEEIAMHVRTNILAAILFTRCVIRAFQHWGCPKTFVNISSGAAWKGSAGWSLYCASKAAMENFVRAVALEQSSRPHPIRAISVNPGVMDTGMQAGIRGTRSEDFPARERYVRLMEDGRLASPAVVAGEIADLVASRPEPGGSVSVRSWRSP